MDGNMDGEVKPLRICFICGEYPPATHGGVGVVTQSLARELARRGHRVSVIGVREADDGSADFEIDAGVQVERLPRPRLPKVGWIQARYQLYQQVAKRVREGEIDLIEAPDYEGWNAFWRPLPVPVVVRLHGSGSYYAAEMGRPLQRSLYHIERMSLRRASFICSTSRYTADRTAELFQLDLNDAQVIYNGVPASVSSSWRPDGARVVYTGTLVQKKGVIQLAKAWPRIVRQCPEAELHLYGKDGRTNDGSSMREHLLKLLGRDSARVFFHGHVPSSSIPEILSRARVSVFPSYSEAFALAPLEAMAQGCPTIYSRRASGPELITHGEDGLLVDPDDVDELANAVASLLIRPDYALRVARAGQSRVQNMFATSVVVEQNERFFRSCISAFRN